MIVQKAPNARSERLHEVRHVTRQACDLPVATVPAITPGK